MTTGRRRWIVAGMALLLVTSVSLVVLPEVIRRVAINKIKTFTGREAAIEDVDLNLFTGRAAIKGFRLSDRGSNNPFVQFDSLGVRVRLLPLMTGRLRLTEIVLVSPAVNVVRTGPTQFNFSDLLEPKDKEAPKEKPEGQGIALDLTLDRFNLTGGAVSLEDHAVTPSRSWKAEGLSVEVTDLSTTATGPGGKATVNLKLAGTPISLQASDLRLVPAGGNATISVQAFDLALVVPYLPPTVPVTLQSGLMTTSLQIGHHAENGSTAEGEVRFENLTLLQRGQSGPFFSAPLLTVAAKGVTATGEGVSVGRLELAGNPSLFDRNLQPSPRFDLKPLKVSVADVTWPTRGPAQLEVHAGLPGKGTLDVQGPVRIAPMGAELRVALKSLDVGTYQRYIPISAPLSAKVDAALTVVASKVEELTANVKGKADVSGIALGQREKPTVSVERVEATGIDVRWPGRIAISRVAIRKPSALIERNESGELPLRAMFTNSSPAPAAEPAKEEKAPPSKETAPAAKKPTIEIGEVVVEEGFARFEDRTGSPPFTEELPRLAVNLKNLSNAPGKPGQLTLQGIIGATGALELKGEVAPLGESLFVDMDGELRDFAIPRTNPYTNRLLAWIAKDGRLTTKLRFKIDGDKLEARSDLVVGRLEMVQAGDNDEAKRRIGLPLGLIVSLIKDVNGEIRLGIPVSGNLSSPEFSLGEAIWAAVRNVIVNVLTAPFQLIGRLFTKDDKIEGFAIDPVRFEPGTAVFSQGMEEQVKRLGDFLRNSPFIRVGLKPVVSEADMASLKTQEITARLQRLQRDQKLADLKAAAGRLFSEKFPRRPMPQTLEEMVAALREVEPAPEEAGRGLAARRLQVTRESLIKSAGIDSKRLESTEGDVKLGAQGEGEVQFAIVS